MLRKSPEPKGRGEGGLSDARVSPPRAGGMAYMPVAERSPGSPRDGRRGASSSSGFHQAPLSERDEGAWPRPQIERRLPEQPEWGAGRFDSVIVSCRFLAPFVALLCAALGCTAAVPPILSALHGGGGSGLAHGPVQPESDLAPGELPMPTTTTLPDGWVPTFESCVVISLTVRGVDYALLEMDQPLKLAFRRTIARAIAQEAGPSAMPQGVRVGIQQGTVANLVDRAEGQQTRSTVSVDASVVPTVHDDQALSVVTDALSDTSELGVAVARNVANLVGIDSAAVGPIIVSNLRVAQADVSGLCVQPSDGTTTSTVPGIAEAPPSPAGALPASGSAPPPGGVVYNNLDGRGPLAGSREELRLGDVLEVGGRPVDLQIRAISSYRPERPASNGASRGRGVINLAWGPNSIIY